MQAQIHRPPGGTVNRAGTGECQYDSPLPTHAHDLSAGPLAADAHSLESHLGQSNKVRLYIMVFTLSGIHSLFVIISMGLVSNVALTLSSHLSILNKVPICINLSATPRRAQLRSEWANTATPGKAICFDLRPRSGI